MDAPRGRYRVVEKDGRLVVIDNETGVPIPSSIASPPSARRGRSAASPAAPVAPAGPGPIDRAAEFLLAIAAREWDAEGRAVIAWEWGEPGKGQRWDAVLGEAQQRRMGRALLTLCAAPLVLVVAMLAEDDLFGFGFLVILAPLAWAAISLLRLYGETNDPSLRR